MIYILMATSYFMMLRPKSSSILDSSNEDIVCAKNKNSYILPSNLLSCYASDGLFEGALIDWCKQFCMKDKVFLDIGAHTGTYTISLAEYADHVHAFEPQKMTYYSLCGGVALSNLTNVTCHHFGLGSEEQVGKQTLRIISNDGGGSSIQEQENALVLSTEEVEIRTLDSLELDNIGFIKIDVEDNEIYALKGGVKTLERCGYPPIVFECNDEAKSTELWEFLTSLDMSIIKIARVENMYLATKNV